MTAKTQKELAFLRDLVLDDWTESFTNLIDKNLKFEDDERILYINSGTGNHAIALAERLGKYAEIYGVCEDEELLSIAKAKSEATKTELDFSCSFPNDKFDTVLADASFVKPSKLDNFLTQIIKYSTDRVAVFLPTAGSFGEIFSFLWETLLDEDLLDKNIDVESLISEIPTVSKVETLVQEIGLNNIQSFSHNEISEFKDGAEFINAPLVSEFFFPVWFSFLDDKEKEQVTQKLAQIIDADDQDMTFRYSVKATLVVGDKRGKG
jgi:hypothetical protein